MDAPIPSPNCGAGPAARQPHRNPCREWGRCTEGGEAPGGPGATTENTGCI